MLAGSAEDYPRPCFPADLLLVSKGKWVKMTVNLLPTAKENGHDKCMWKSHLDAVDETVASTLKESKVVMVGGVGDYIAYE